jgi:hypothetical protein
MPKRFNNLKAALKLLRPLAGGDPVDLADTSALGFFQAVQAGKKDVKYGDRPEGSEPGKLITYSLIPFATPVNTAPRVLVGMSQRSETNFAKAGLTAADLNVGKTAENLAAAADLVGFVAAKCTVRVSGTSTTEKTSKLTGQKYKTKGGDSYSYPMGFGVGETAKGYKDVKSAVLAKVKTGSNNRSASFTPEIYR